MKFIMAGGKQTSCGLLDGSQTQTQSLKGGLDQVVSELLIAVFWPAKRRKKERKKKKRERRKRVSKKRKRKEREKRRENRRENKRE